MYIYIQKLAKLVMYLATIESISVNYIVVMNKLNKRLGWDMIHANIVNLVDQFLIILYVSCLTKSLQILLFFIVRLKYI